jgi:C1A family cysteine protease
MVSMTRYEKNAVKIIKRSYQIQMLNYQILLVCMETNGNCDLYNCLTVFLIDWRDKGDVVHVKDQGQCGSCWAFSAVGSIESAYAIKTGKLVSLSEQQLVDCSGKYGNMGCNGGLMDQAFKYLTAVGGIETEVAYPYQAIDKICVFNTSKVVVKVCGFIDIKSKDEAALQQAVATIGPMSVAIDASHSSFQLYHSGGMYFSSLLIVYYHFTRFV